MTAPERDTQRLAFACNALERDSIQLERASSDAGFRSYWRARDGERSWVVMDSPPELEDVRPWLRLQRVLGEGGVRVPQVLAADEASGFLLLEDLGRDTLLDVMDASSAATWFDAAIAELVRLQSIPCPADLPVYDEAMLRRELALFRDWYLLRHLALPLNGDDEQALQSAFDELVAHALAQPRVLVHRDFMPRNLMPNGAGLAVLDFQDAVRGPVSYDPLCLFKDAFVSWPESQVAQWLERYRQAAVDAGLPVPDARAFRRDTDLIGVHRHLKVLGIFARLKLRDDKPRYIADAPRFLAYLNAVLPRHQELRPLEAFFASRLRPALRAHAAA